MRPPWSHVLQKLFTAVIKARLFVIVGHFHPSLIFAGKAMNLPLEWSPVMYAPAMPANIRLGRKRLSGPSSLLRYGVKYCRKKV